MEFFFSILLWLGAISCGLMAGVYFAFSAFIMKSLASIDEQSGMKSMQSINDVILKSLFMPLFFGSTSISVLSIALYFSVSIDNSIYVLFAGLTYFFGMFICTVICNVPLNNKLKDSNIESEKGSLVWKEYLQIWTRWNHLRTIASTLSSLLYIAAIAL